MPFSSVTFPPGMIADEMADSSVASLVQKLMSYNKELKYASYFDL